MTVSITRKLYCIAAQGAICGLMAFNACQHPSLFSLAPLPVMFTLLRVIVDDAAIAMEARQGGDGETRPHPKDDSAGPQGHRP